VTPINYAVLAISQIYFRINGWHLRDASAEKRARAQFIVLLIDEAGTFLFMYLRAAHKSALIERRPLASTFLIKYNVHKTVANFLFIVVCRLFLVHTFSIGDGSHGKRKPVITPPTALANNNTPHTRRRHRLALCK
jgi:hypothetical protein